LVHPRRVRHRPFQLQPVPAPRMQSGKVLPNQVPKGKISNP
jgi:hypothetical protein